MLKLAIVSRDYAIYAASLHSLGSAKAQVECIYAGPVANNQLTQAADILLCEPNLASSFIDQCNQLKWLQSTWAGNNVLQNHPKRDYLLTGTKGIFAAQMREYVFAYLLYFQRQIPEFISLQNKQTWQQNPIETLSQKRLGIMGLGSIGCEVAVMAKHFDMQISAITATNKPLKDADYYALDALSNFAKKCDYIVNLLPETKDTRGVCDADFFDAMKPTAVFLNAGRGSLIKNDQVLIDALQQGKIKAAVLDVFTQEPLSGTHPFYHLKNCYLTNHTAAVSNPEAVCAVFLQNLERFVASQPLLYQHDFNKGY